MIVAIPAAAVRIENDGLKRLRKHRHDLDFVIREVECGKRGGVGSSEHAGLLCFGNSRILPLANISLSEDRGRRTKAVPGRRGRFP